jgi:hypothetical protein
VEEPSLQIPIRFIQKCIANHSVAGHYSFNWMSQHSHCGNERGKDLLTKKRMLDMRKLITGGRQERKRMLREEGGRGNADFVLPGVIEFF